MKILIADDEPVSKRLLERTLERLGHEVVAVSDGEEALAVLLTTGGPRLAILDWMMPRVDGLGVCRAVRRRAAPYVYVILLTARTSPEDMLMAIDGEVDEFLTKPVDMVELRARLRSAARVLELQEGLLRTQEELRRLASYDSLTGLWNRAAVVEHLAVELQRASRAHSPVSVALVDLDHFKQVNDTCGHAAGDVVLRQAGKRMQSVLRAHDALGRYGGEEFLIVLPGCAHASALDVAERVRAVIANKPAFAGELEWPMTVSVGVASTVTERDNANELIERADRALYKAKASGRNCVEAEFSCQ